MSDIQRPWDAPKPKPNRPERSPQEARSGSRRFWAGLVIAIVVLGLVGWCSVETKNNATEADANGNGREATAACHQFVESRLKSPGSADYSTETATQESGPDWTVAGIVDSQNSFGASVRNGYRCEVTSTGGGHYRLRNIDLDGN